MLFQVAHLTGLGQEIPGGRACRLAGQEGVTAMVIEIFEGPQEVPSQMAEVVLDPQEFSFEGGKLRPEGLQGALPVAGQEGAFLLLNPGPGLPVLGDDLIGVGAEFLLKRREICPKTVDGFLPGLDLPALHPVDPEEGEREADDDQRGL